MRFYIKKSKNNNYIQKLLIYLEYEHTFFKNILNKIFKLLLIMANEFKDFLMTQKTSKKIVGFGCPARFSTITNFINIDKSLIPM